MANSWQDEARGLPVWENCGMVAPGGLTDHVRIHPQTGVHRETPEVLADWGAFPNLENGDVRAAFTRRLALRLGASEELVDDGVGFWQGNDVWIVMAGKVTVDLFDDGHPEWFCHVAKGVPDRLLALVRAWRSVP